MDNIDQLIERLAVKSGKAEKDIEEILKLVSYSHKTNKDDIEILAETLGKAYKNTKEKVQKLKDAIKMLHSEDKDEKKELNEAISEIKAEFKLEVEKLIEKVSQVKAQKGDTGEQGVPGIPGKDGERGQIGPEGSDGKDGADGKDGEDGSPDTPEEIRDKLSTLKKDERLDAKHIKNLDKIIEAGWDKFGKYFIGGGSSGGASKFTALTDTPSDYTGYAGYALKVNGAEDALEFYVPTDLDEKLKISSVDTTAGYLEDKIVAGFGITLTKQNTGANENIRISTPSLLEGPVEDWYDPTGGLPADPTIGDRYIAETDGSGWSTDYIYEWDGDEWVEYEPEEGWMVWMLMELVFWVFFSGGWMEAGSGSYWSLYNEQWGIEGDKHGSFNLDTTGDITAGNLNIANWDTAYGWGNPSGVYLPLTGGVLTGNLEISKADAEYRLTNLSGEYSRWIRSDTDNTMYLYNRVYSVTTSNAISFDGTNEFGFVADDINQDIGTGDFTIAFWMKTTEAAANYNSLLGKGTLASSVGRWYFIGTTTSIIFGVQFSSSKQVSTTWTSINDGVWHSMVGVFDRDGYMTFYVDGVSVGTPLDISSFSAEDLNTTCGLMLAGLPSTAGGTTPAAGSYYNGAIDELCIWKGRALTTTEITDFHNAGAGAYITSSGTFATAGTSMGTNLVSVYHFDSVSGLTATDSISAINIALTNTEDADWVTGIVPATGAVVEVPVVTSMNGISAGEYAIHTFGDANSRLVHEGLTQRFNTAGVERMHITNAGLVGIGRTPTTNYLEIKKSAGFYAEANDDGMNFYDVNNANRVFMRFSLEQDGARIWGKNGAVGSFGISTRLDASTYFNQEGATHTGGFIVGGGTALTDANYLIQFTQKVNCITDVKIGGSFFPKKVTDAGPMTATNGTVGEIVYNLSNNKFYGCTATGTPATWAAFH